MTALSAEEKGGARAGALLLACIADHGTLAHPYSGSAELLRGSHAPRNLADAIHFLCVLHGRHPGVFDHPSFRTTEPPARAWLGLAAPAFASERAYLARLAVAAGPLPGTPGAGDSGAVVLAQRHAIEMLACSERSGCATGAALALALDWEAIRAVLDAAAERFGIEPAQAPWSAGTEILRIAGECAASAPIQRALLFGAQQLLVQHHGLWDLLEARQQARDA